MAQSGETFEIIRGAEALDLTDLITNGVPSTYNVIEFEGLGMAPVERFEQSGPAQDGATDRGYRLLPRNIRMFVRGEAGTPTQFHSRRERLIQMCRPSVNPIQLRWTFEDGTQRQIDCHYAGGLDMPTTSAGRVGKWSFRDVIVLRAPDPTFYDPNGYSYQIPMAYSASGHTFPVTFPSTFGGTSVDSTVNLQMSGTSSWGSYPTIYATGLLTNLVITNQTTGKVLDFTGNSIPSGNVWTIVTQWGAHSITNQAGTNQISKLTATSTLSTFRLVEGDNSIRVTASVLDASAGVLFQGEERFFGN